MRGGQRERGEDWGGSEGYGTDIGEDGAGGENGEQLEN